MQLGPDAVVAAVDAVVLLVPGKVVRLHDHQRVAPQRMLLLLLRGAVGAGLQVLDVDRTGGGARRRRQLLLRLHTLHDGRSRLLGSDGGLSLVRSCDRQVQEGRVGEGGVSLDHEGTKAAKENIVKRPELSFLCNR